MILQRLKQGLALSLVALLAACGSTTPSANSPGGSGYLLTVNLEQTDTQASVAQRYGGEVIAWLGDKAILKMTDEAVAQMQTRGVSLQNTTLDPNSAVAAPVNAAGWNAWSGGWNAWSSGWNAWSGGWNAWSGGVGTLPAAPSENRYPFKQVALPQAQVLVSKYGDGVKVAVIDTGLDLSHPMFTGRLAPSSEWKDFIDGDANPQDVSGGTAYGHGTVVAGIIAQYAPKVTLLPIRVLGSNGGGDVGNVISAIDWAIQKGTHIINLSLGATSDVAALKTQIAYATSLGIYVVASAGNDGSSTALTYPAEYATTISNSQYLISVGSSDDTTALSTFSNRNSALEIAAFGESVFSGYPGSQVAYAKGTSFAAPQISGALALARSNTAPSNYSSLGNLLYSNSIAMANQSSRYLSMHTFITSLPGFVRTRNVLFVVGNTTLNTGDTAVANRLQWLGYNVITRTGSTATTADATGRDLVIISSTVNPNDVNTKFKSVTTPVLTWESQLFDDLAMVSATSGNFGTATSQTRLIMPSSASSHPLSGGMAGYFSTANTVFGASGTMSWGKPPATATVIATLPSDSTRAVIFGYDRGTTMAGMTAPGRRVAFMFDDTSSFNSHNFWASCYLFDSAVIWAMTGS